MIDFCVKKCVFEKGAKRQNAAKVEYLGRPASEIVADWAVAENPLLRLSKQSARINKRSRDPARNYNTCFLRIPRNAKLSQLEVRRELIETDSRRHPFTGIPSRQPSSEIMASGFELGTVEVSSSPQERFAEFLQSKGKRITQQRRILVDHVFERHDHFDAEELIINLATQPEGARRSAVRRCIAR